MSDEVWYVDVEQFTKTYGFRVGRWYRRPSGKCVQVWGWTYEDWPNLVRVIYRDVKGREQMVRADVARREKWELLEGAPDVLRAS